MAADLHAFFERYERLFNSALAGAADMDEVASLYAPAFVAASPAGVMTGENDDRLRQVMAQGYEHYRSIGTKEMRMRGLRTSPIDERHSIAHVGWTAVYAREGQPDVAIEFEVHYLVQVLDSGPRVFGWIAGDEQALLKAHGIV